MDAFIEDFIVLLPGLAVLGLLIIASAFFSGCETALFFLSRDELRSLQLGNARERRVAELLRDPDRLLTAVLFWNLLTNLTYFAVSVVLARQAMARNQGTLAGVVGIGSLLTIILIGEVLPKSTRWCSIGGSRFRPAGHSPSRSGCSTRCCPCLGLWHASCVAPSGPTCVASLTWTSTIWNGLSRPRT